MRHQMEYLGSSLALVLDGTAQRLDVSRKLIQQCQQILPPPRGPRRQGQRLQLASSALAPQFLLTLEAFVQRDRLQLIHIAKVSEMLHALRCHLRLPRKDTRHT
jgi:hypothetical protein